MKQSRQPIRRLRPHRQRQRNLDRRYLPQGLRKGFKVGIENITPAMILGYVLVYILKETGLMDILGTVMSPVMGLFGLPGEAFAVLISRSSPRPPAARPLLPCMRLAR